MFWRILTDIYVYEKCNSSFQAREEESLIEPFFAQVRFTFTSISFLIDIDDSIIVDFLPSLFLTCTAHEKKIQLTQVNTTKITTVTQKKMQLLKEIEMLISDKIWRHLLGKRTNPYLDWASTSPKVHCLGILVLISNCMRVSMSEVNH